MIPLKPAGILGGLPDFGQIIIDAITSVIIAIAEAILKTLVGLVQGIKDLVISAPYPQKSDGSPAFFDPRNDAVSTSDPLNLWLDVFNTNIYAEAVLPVALTIFVIAFAVGYFGKLLEDFPGLEDFTPSLTRVFFLFLLAITWLPVMTGILAFSDGVANTMVQLGSNIGGSSSSSLSAGNLGAALLTIVFAILSLSTVIFGLAFWVLRYILLYQLGIFMPVFLALKAFKEVRVPFIGDLGDKGWDLWFFAAFANIPSAIAFLFVGSSGALAKSIGNALSGGGLLGGLLATMVRVVAPLFALYAPIIFIFLFDQEGAVGNVGDTVVETAESAAGAAAAAGSAGAAGLTTALDDEDDSSAIGTTAVEMSNNLADSDNRVVSNIGSKGQRAAATAQQTKRAAMGQDLADLSDEQNSALASASGLEDSTFFDEDQREYGVVGAKAGNALRNAAVNGEPEAEDERLAKAEQAENKIGDNEAFGNFMTQVSNVNEKNAETAEDLLSRGYDGDYEEQLEALEMAANGDIRMSEDDVLAIDKEVDEFSAEEIEENKLSIAEQTGLRTRQLDSLTEQIEDRSTARSVVEQPNADPELVDDIIQNTDLSSAQDLAEAEEKDIKEQMQGIEPKEANEAINAARAQVIEEQLGIENMDSPAVEQVVDTFDIENGAQMKDFADALQDVGSLDEQMHDAAEEIDAAAVEEAKRLSEVGEERAKNVIEEATETTISDLKQYNSVSELSDDLDIDNFTALDKELDGSLMQDDYSEVTEIVEEIQRKKVKDTQQAFEDVDEVADAKMAQQLEDEVDAGVKEVGQLAEAAQRGDVDIEEAAGAVGEGSGTSAQSLDELTSTTDMTRNEALEASESINERVEAAEAAIEDQMGVEIDDDGPISKDALFDIAGAEDKDELKQRASLYLSQEMDDSDRDDFKKIMVAAMMDDMQTEFDDEPSYDASGSSSTSSSSSPDYTQ